MKTLLSACLLILTSCSQSSDIDIQQELTVSSVAQTTVTVIEQPKIAYFEIYRPHKIFSMPKIYLKPLPLSRHSHPYLTLLLY